MSVAEATALPAPRSATPFLGRLVRWGLAAALIAWCVAALVHAESFRHLEARIAGWATSLLFSREVRLMTYEPVIVFERVAGDDATWFGLRITPSCSALYFLVPLALVAAFVLVTGRAGIGRIAVATLTTAAFLELLNVVRVEVMVLAVTRWGTEVFDWVHDTLGSALMLGGFTVALVFFFRLGFFGRRGARSARRAHHGDARDGDAS
ncbi:exosortase/archaeosortase family protein [Cellulosimicrobium cellulans]|uniref:exosortase/archaeosortase family protein n=1 Tax=Cellulosimicrobium cellulans TaxID=1710 RepID=UPI00381BB11E